MNNVVGQFVKKIREQQGLTQEQLAIRIEMAGWQVDRFIVSKMERGDRQVSDIEARLIAKWLKSHNSLEKNIFFNCSLLLLLV